MAEGVVVINRDTIGSRGCGKQSSKRNIESIERAGGSRNNVSNSGTLPHAQLSCSPKRYRKKMLCNVY